MAHDSAEAPPAKLLYLAREVNLTTSRGAGVVREGLK
jgi:hypothetical protein